jgi:hypothetical protein
MQHPIFAPDFPIAVCHFTFGFHDFIEISNWLNPQVRAEF